MTWQCRCGYNQERTPRCDTCGELRPHRTCDGDHIRPGDRVAYVHGIALAHGDVVDPTPDCRTVQVRFDGMVGQRAVDPSMLRLLERRT